MGRKHVVLPEMEVPGRVEIKHHGEAIVSSVEQSISGEMENLHTRIQDAILDLARWTETQGGLVGHIKAAVQTASGTRVYSCTGDEVHIHVIEEPGEKLAFTAILFFVDQTELKQKMEQFLDML